MTSLLDPVHFSNLKRIAQSPAHYREAVLHPTAPTAAMRLGTLVHARVLGGWKEMAVWDGVRRGKEWEAFKAEHAGQEIVTASEMADAEPIAEAALYDPISLDLLDSCPAREVEHRFCIGDRACSMRPDAFGPDVLIDLKTTSDASPGRFPWQCMKLGYYAQMAWYRDGLGGDRQPFIIAVETKPPFVVQVYEVSPASLDYGRRCYRLWWERLMVCEASDEWPGYTQRIETLEPPDGADDLTLTIGGESVEL